jgi:hypothetical protein
MTRMVPRLKLLLRQRHWQTHRTFCDEYDKAAREIDLRLVGTGPSRVQLHRWVSGELRGLPYPDHCRTLERMFPGLSAEQLFELIPADQQPETASGPPLARQVTAAVNAHGLDLSGNWWAAWQTWKDSAPRIDTHPLLVDQQGDLLRLDADRAIPVEEGSYRWRGELRLWDNEALMGWYHATDAAVRSKGTIYFALHPQGTHAWGRWVGMSYDGPVISGLGAMARTQERVETVIRKRLEAEHP